MSVNKERPHVVVLPEDAANRQLAVGFSSHAELGSRNIQVLRIAGGWIKVLDRFNSYHVPEMNRLPARFMVLLSDFDRDETRLQSAKARIPGHLTDRVFILGAWTEPEDLKTDFGPYEEIGRRLANDCREETNTTWDHYLLRHNAGELDRLRRYVRPILFPSA